MSDANDPAPAAGGPRAGERFLEEFRDTYWRVYEWGTVGAVCVARCENKADADFLAHGRGELARLRAENAGLRGALTEAYVALVPPDGVGLSLAGVDLARIILRDALAAAPPEPA